MKTFQFTHHIFSAAMLLALLENNSNHRNAVQAFSAQPIGGQCAARQTVALGSYLDSLSSNEDDANESPKGPPMPKKDISVNSYLDSLSRPNQEAVNTNYGDISYGQGGINPASWTASQTANGYLENIAGVKGATPSPWDSGKSPSPWTPPNTAAKFAPVPSDNQASKDQGLLFFANVLSSQQNQQQPGLPTESPPKNADIQNQAIGDKENNQSPLPSPDVTASSTANAPSLPSPGVAAVNTAEDTQSPIPQPYKSLYEDIEEDVGVIHPRDQKASQQEPSDPIASVEVPRDPEKYTSVPQPGEVVAPPPMPAPRSSSGPPSWVVQATQESNSMPVQPLPEPEEQPVGPQFRSEMGGIPADVGYSTQPAPQMPQPMSQPAPAPVKKESPVVLAPQPDQQVVEFKKSAPAVDDQQRDLDNAFLRLADALAKSSNPGGGQVGAVLVSLEGEILGEGGNDDAVLEAMQQSGFRFVPPRNGEGIGVTPPRAIDPRTMTLYTTCHPEDIRITKAIRNSCIGRVVVQGD